MLFSRLIISALCMWSVQALPVQEEKNSLSARTLPNGFFDHAVAAIRAHAIGPTKTMMHSGIGAAGASRIARRKGLQTVETTIAYALMKEPARYKDILAPYCVPKDQYCAQPGNMSQDWVQAWAQISKAWAQYTEEQTTLATHSGGPDLNSFYKTVEEPILQGKQVRINIENQHSPSEN